MFMPARTEANAVEPLRLPKKTVQLPHLAHCGLRPAFRCYNGLNLVSQRLQVFLGGRQVEVGMRYALL